MIVIKTPKYARLNIEIAFPELSEQEKTQLAQQAAINEVKAYFEFFHIWGNKRQDNINLIHRITGENYLHQALEKGNGIVLIVPHFGTWEIMNAWVSQYTQMTIMYKPLKNKTINSFVLQARSREHAILVPTDESGIKQIFKALKQGGTTVILPDHSPDHISEMCNWFGVPLYSSQLSAKLIQKTKATPLLLYAMRNQQAGFEMFIEPMPDSLHDHTQNGTAIIHQTIEQLIRRYPEHYHWSYKRFKANPKIKDLYTIDKQQALELIRSIRISEHSSRQ